jgi:hypothetical protein
MDQPLATAPTTAVNPAAHSYVDWCAIALGTVIAAAISIVLLTFGTGVGLSMISPYRGEGVSAPMYFVVFGLWLLWVEVSSFMAGGYVAGRMRRRVGDASEHEVDVRDGTHGFGVWAFGIVVVSFFVILGATGIGAVVGGSAAAGAAAGATSNADGKSDMLVDTLLRPGPSASTSADASGSSVDRRAEVGRILSFGTVRGELSTDNRTYLARIVAERTGLSQAEAEARVDQTLAEAKRAADAARKAGVIMAFLMAAALAVAGAAAAWAATLGGKHRDQETDHSQFWRWR